MATDPRSLRRIVLTGAPGSGKTTIVRELARRLGDRVVIVPEAATQYYTGLGLRWDQLTVEQRRDAQRAIYRLQVNQENLIDQAHPDRTIVLDRGTIDGSAYWPDGPDNYWIDLKTTHAEQLQRYDRVLVLETAAQIGIYDGGLSNHIRFEDASGAVEAGRLLERLWLDHPDLHQVRARPLLEEKIQDVIRLIGDFAKTNL